MSDITVRELTAGDLPEVARAHLAAFPESILSRLGEEIVARYYAWQLSDANETYTTGVFAGDRLMGFAFGGFFHDSLNGFFRANRPLIASAVIRRPWLVLDPVFWNRFSMTLSSLGRERARKRQQAAGASEAPGRRKRPFSILSIATHPDHQRKGVGKLLIADQEERARRLGLHEIRLSVHPENEGAVSFYLNQGWQKLDGGDGWTGKMNKAL